MVVIWDLLFNNLLFVGLMCGLVFVWKSGVVFSACFCVCLVLLFFIWVMVSLRGWLDIGLHLCCVGDLWLFWIWSFEFACCCVPVFDFVWLWYLLFDFWVVCFDVICIHGILDNFVLFSLVGCFGCLTWFLVGWCCLFWICFIEWFVFVTFVCLLFCFLLCFLVRQRWFYWWCWLLFVVFVVLLVNVAVWDLICCIVCVCLLWIDLRCSLRLLCCWCLTWLFFGICFVLRVFGVVLFYYFVF